MKKQYVVIVVIIVVMMAVLLGVYKVGNSVIFNSIGMETIILNGNHNKLFNIIQNTDNEQFKNERKNYFSEYNILELEDTV